MCPCPDAATLGIQKLRGLLPAGSKSVPDWTRVGEVVRLPISYQRDPSRPPPPVATPEAFTLILWIIAAKSRSSRASRGKLGTSLAVTGMGWMVRGTVMLRLPEIVGEPPG